MKNLLSLLIALGFIFGVAACEPKPATDEAEDTERLDDTEEEIEEEVEEEDVIEE